MSTNVHKSVHMNFILDIPLLPPSLNAWISCHWAKRKRIKDEWTNAIWALVNEQHIPPMDKVHLEATLYFATKRTRDVDNYVVIYKIAQDSLVRIGFIPDDSTDHVSISPPVLEVDPDHPRTELIIIER